MDLYYCRTNSDYIITRVNPAFCSLTDQEAKTGQSLEILLEDSPWSVLIQHSYTLTIDNSRTEVNINSVDFDLEAFFSENGEVVEYQFIAAAVDKGMSAGQLVTRSFDAWFRQLPFASIVIDEAMQFHRVNEAFCLLTDYSRDEVENRANFLDIFLKREHRAKAVDYLKLRRLSPDAPPLRFEADICTRNGDNLDVVVYLLASPEANRSVVSLIDITIQKRNADYGRDRSDKFFHIFNDNPEPIMITTPGNPRIVDANKVFCRKIGRSRSDLVGKALNTTGFQFDASVKQAIVSALSAGHTADLLLENQDGAGKLLLMQTMVERVLLDGNMFWLWMGRDVTAVKQYEKEIIKTEMMESLGTLAGGIAHDFNNLLAVILGYSELALSAVKNDEQTVFYLDEIIKAGHRAEDLVGQILLFGAPTETQSEAISMDAFTSESLRVCRRMFTTDATFEEICRCRRSVQADPSHLHQIIQQLVSNAVQAVETAVKPRIRVLLSDVEVDAACGARLGFPPGQYVRLKVHDNGIGMDGPTVARMFEPYFSTRSRVHGNGLGLAIVHGIVSKLGGQIRVSTRPKSGTVVTILLPSLERGGGKPFRPAAVDRASERVEKKILLVDDEPAVLNMLKMHLERAGFRVVACDSSTRALELFQLDSEIDLVITDQTMPELTGAQLAGRILQLNSQMPVILCTGYSETMDAAKAQLMGIRKFLMKPVVGKELIRNVREVFDVR